MDKLKKQVIFYSAGFLVVLWLLLFLPAWSLIFWQGWVCWFIVSFSVIMIDVYFLKKDPKLIKRRMKLGTAGEKERAQKIIQSFAGVFYVMLFVIPGFDYRFHWSNVPVFLVIIANVFVLLAYYNCFRVFKENTFSSSVIEVDTDQRVITTGPYRIVRHPMYSGAILLFIATPVALGSYWALLLVLPLTIIIIIRLLDEEKFLTANLPGYNEYCEKIRYRLIPLIW
jgi:protein-S-isoprenylcysteine O-methyltransferase Ste14